MFACHVSQCQHRCSVLWEAGSKALTLWTEEFRSSSLGRRMVE